MRLWIMSQDGEKLMLAQQFEIKTDEEGVVIYVNYYSAGRYSSKERAMEVLSEIEDQLRNGSCFEDIYPYTKVSKQNVYHMPKE